jgi:hypothetical protein
MSSKVRENLEGYSQNFLRSFYEWGLGLHYHEGKLSFKVCLQGATMLSMTTLSVATFSITTLSIKGLNATLSTNVNQHK